MYIFPLGRWRPLLRCVLAAFFLVFVGRAAFASIDPPYPAPGFNYYDLPANKGIYADPYGNERWVTGGTHTATCDKIAAMSGWNVAPFKYTLTYYPNNIGAGITDMWICQRVDPNGPLPPGVTPSYRSSAIINPVCQVDPATSIAPPGTPYRYAPKYASFRKCSCQGSDYFDRSTEWCTEAPTCQWYPENKGSNCGKTTEAMYTVLKSKSPTDPTRIFHSPQTCVSHKACNLRCKMDNCNWLAQVIPDFARPYLEKHNDWNAVEAKCRSRGTGWLADRLCGAEMSKYHIDVDLLNALAKSGCGSQNDWNQVFESIRQCTVTAFSNSVEQVAAGLRVKQLRDKVRGQCIAVRQAKGLNPDINDALKGKTCAP